MKYSEEFCSDCKEETIHRVSGDLEGKIPMEARLLRELLLGA